MKRKNPIIGEWFQVEFFSRIKVMVHIAHARLGILPFSQSAVDLNGLSIAFMLIDSSQRKVESRR